MPSKLPQIFFNFHCYQGIHSRGYDKDPFFAMLISYCADGIWKKYIYVMCMYKQACM